MAVSTDVVDDTHLERGHNSSAKKSKLVRFQELIWDGPRSPEEKRIVRRLDLHLMSWATFGYFVRLLDSTNITNAYVSGMREDLNFHGNQYNLLATFFTCGYLVGQIPSQLLLTRVRASWYLPAIEFTWAIITFCFAAVQNVQQVFALRFLIGMLESPFAVGVLAVMGSWYTPRELAKRIAIFYSASYAASMFSGYLQAGIYRGMDGTHGLAGWRWLFIFCGVISLPASFWGFYAVPDNPYTTKARWINEDQKQAYRSRMEKLDRRGPVRLPLAKIRKILTHWPLYVMILTLISHCVVTQPLNYFAVWLKSLDRFSVYQVNLFPTAAQGLGLVTTLAYGWISDGLGGKRWQVLIVPAILNFVGMVTVASGPSYGATFFGYLLNAASWGFWPVLYAWASEFCHDDAEERAIVIAVAQTFGQAFIAWVPVVILDVGKYAPNFTMGFSVMSGISVIQFTCIFVLRFFVNRDKAAKRAAAAAGAGPEGEAKMWDGQGSTTGSDAEPTGKGLGDEKGNGAARVVVEATPAGKLMAQSL